jgi:hypothetical protein
MDFACLVIWWQNYCWKPMTRTSFGAKWEKRSEDSYSPGIRNDVSFLCRRLSTFCWAHSASFVVNTGGAELEAWDLELLATSSLLRTSELAPRSNLISTLLVSTPLQIRAKWRLLQITHRLPLMPVYLSALFWCSVWDITMKALTGTLSFIPHVLVQNNGCVCIFSDRDGYNECWKVTQGGNCVWRRRRRKHMNISMQTKWFHLSYWLTQTNNNCCHWACCH